MTELFFYQLQPLFHTYFVASVPNMKKKHPVAPVHIQSNKSPYVPHKKAQDKKTYQEYVFHTLLQVYMLKHPTVIVMLLLEKRSQNMLQSVFGLFFIFHFFTFSHIHSPGGPLQLLSMTTFWHLPCHSLLAGFSLYPFLAGIPHPYTPGCSQTFYYCHVYSYHCHCALTHSLANLLYTPAVYTHAPTYTLSAITGAIYSLSKHPCPPLAVSLSFITPCVLPAQQGHSVPPFKLPA